MNTRILRGLLAAVSVAAFAASPALAAMPMDAAAGAARDSAVIQIAKKQKQKKMTRREEADKSYKDGTVPSRYRRDVPKEYQQYIPWAK